MGWDMFAKGTRGGEITDKRTISAFKRAAKAVVAKAGSVDGLLAHAALSTIRPAPTPDREKLVEEMARAIQRVDEQNGSRSWDYYVSQGYKEYIDNQREKAEAALAVIENRKD